MVYCVPYAVYAMLYAFHFSAAWVVEPHATLPYTQCVIIKRVVNKRAALQALWAIAAAGAHAWWAAGGAVVRRCTRAARLHPPAAAAPAGDQVKGVCSGNGGLSTDPGHGGDGAGAVWGEDASTAAARYAVGVNQPSVTCSTPKNKREEFMSNSGKDSYQSGRVGAQTHTCAFRVLHIQCGAE